MPGLVMYKKIGLMLSLAACAFVVGTQARGFAQRLNDQGLSGDLGLESAWPHLRADFSR